MWWKQNKHSMKKKVSKLIKIKIKYTKDILGITLEVGAGACPGSTDEILCHKLHLDHNSRNT